MNGKCLGRTALRVVRYVRFGTKSIHPGFTAQNFTTTDRTITTISSVGTSFIIRN